MGVILKVHVRDFNCQGCPGSNMRPRILTWLRWDLWGPLVLCLALGRVGDSPTLGDRNGDQRLYNNVYIVLDT